MEESIRQCAWNSISEISIKYWRIHFENLMQMCLLRCEANNFRQMWNLSLFIEKWLKQKPMPCQSQRVQVIWITICKYQRWITYIYHSQTRPKIEIKRVSPFVIFNLPISISKLISMNSLACNHNKNIGSTSFTCLNCTIKLQLVTI